MGMAKASGGLYLGRKLDLRSPAERLKARLARGNHFESRLTIKVGVPRMVMPRQPRPNRDTKLHAVSWRRGRVIGG